MCLRINKFAFCNFLVLLYLAVFCQLTNAAQASKSTGINFDETINRCVVNGSQFISNEIIIKFKAQPKGAESNKLNVRNLRSGRLSNIDFSDKNAVLDYLSNKIRDFTIEEVQELVPDSAFDQLSLSRFRSTAANDRLAKTKELKEKYGLYRIHTIKLKNKSGLRTLDDPVQQDCDSIKEIIEQLNRDNNVEYAEPNYIIEKTGFTNDIYLNSTGQFWSFSFDELWGLKRINAPAAWNTSTGSGVVVAVIDTGVDYNHPDLWDNIWVDSDLVTDVNQDGAINISDVDVNGNHSIEPGELSDDFFGHDFAYGDSDPKDKDGHGTHVAGTVAATANNQIGVVGVAHGAKIMILKGLSDSGSGFDSWLASAVIFAADKGAHITSNSWGRQGPGGSTLTNAFAYAHAAGLVNVAAAGNSDEDAGSHIPSSFDTVISVAAIDAFDNRSSFSNYGTAVDIAAPGSNILSTMNADAYIAISEPQNQVGTDIEFGYWQINGTSMATPHVAAVAALLLASKSDLNNEELREIIKDTAIVLDTDKPIGAGLINPVGALQDVNVNVVAKLKLLSNSEIDNGTVNFMGTAMGVDFDHYTLDMIGLDTEEIVNSSTPINNGTLLANFDLSGFPSGNYQAKLSVFNDGGAFKQRTIHFQLIQEIPSAPNNFRAVFDSGSSINDIVLTWEAPDIGPVSSYQLFKVINGVDNGQIADLTKDQLDFTDHSNVNPNNHYTYSLRASNRRGQSEAVVQTVDTTLIDDYGGSFGDLSLTVIDHNLSDDITVSGTINYVTDNDLFKLVIPRVTEIELFTDGGTDTVGTLYNSSGDFMISNDDSGVDLNFNIQTILNPGTYFVEVIGFANSAVGDYVLHSKLSEPVLAGTIDHSGDNELITKSNKFLFLDHRIKYKLILDQTKILTLLSPDRHGPDFVELLDKNGSSLAHSYRQQDTTKLFSRQLSPGMYTLMFSNSSSFVDKDFKIQSYIDVHPDSIPDATPIELGANIQATLDPASSLKNDIDVYEFTIDGSGLVDISAVSDCADLFIELFDDAGNSKAFNDDTAKDSSVNSRIFTFLNAGTYRFRVHTFTVEDFGIYDLAVQFNPAQFLPIIPEHSDDMLTNPAVINSNSQTQAAIEHFGDLDSFKLQLSSNGVLDLSTEGKVDTKLELFDPNLNLIASDDYHGEFFNSAIQRQLAVGNYLVRVSSIGNSTGEYSLISKFIASPQPPASQPPVSSPPSPSAAVPNSAPSNTGGNKGNNDAPTSPADIPTFELPANNTAANNDEGEQPVLEIDKISNKKPIKGEIPIVKTQETEGEALKLSASTSKEFTNLIKFGNDDNNVKEIGKNEKESGIKFTLKKKKEFRKAFPDKDFVDIPITITDSETGFTVETVIRVNLKKQGKVEQ